MLASLGGVFALAGDVGEVSATSSAPRFREGSLFGATLAFGLGMALFTDGDGQRLGAAFPLMLAAVGMPLLIQAICRRPRGRRGDRHALAGFCGTLMTPMAANFLPRPRGPARAQGPYRRDQGAGRHRARRY